MKLFYKIWGSVLIGGVFASHYFGWGLTPTDEVKDVPKTIRENPGAYRTHYVGGK